MGIFKIAMINALICCCGMWTKTQHVVKKLQHTSRFHRKHTNKEGEDGWLCVGRTNLEIKFGDIKQSFAAGLKALVLGADPVMF